MEWQALIPDPETIPAPWWVFETLDIVTFTIHQLLVNIVLGGSLILLVTRLRGRDVDLVDGPPATLVKRIPIAFAMGINFAVAPLLFVQVLYGHLIYTSSILIARYWILVVPFLILAYYGAYIHAYKHARARTLSLVSLCISTLLVLYIAFTLVNNMTLMLHPEKWMAYFDNRGGTLLNLGDPTLLPRYLHFVTASVAVAGLSMAVAWRLRGRRRGVDVTRQEAGGLRIFSVATFLQVLVGLWFLGSLPQHLMILLVGGDPVHTAVLTTGILLGLGACMAGFLGKLWLTVGLLGGTVVLMVINRALLRAEYLKGFFSAGDLEVSPQYGVLALFLAVFAIGIVAVVYMLRAASRASRREVAR
jgi:hypothetical protein